MKQILIPVGAIALIALSYGFSLQQKKSAPAPVATPAKAAAPSDAEVIKAQRPSYPLDTCPISGEKLDKNAVDTVRDGHLVRTCCPKCVAKIDGTTIKKIDDAVVAAQTRSYPMDNCLCGKPLGKEAVNHVIGTRLVRCCSAQCAAMLDKDSKAAMAKLDKAYIDAQLKTYKPTTCPVSGEELSKADSPVNYLYGTRLVRFCCSKCVAQMEKDPEAILKKLGS